MAKLWGTSATTGLEHKPNWLVDSLNPLRDQQKENTYATKDGWVYKRKDGTEEVLVAIRGLNTRLAAATVTSIVFGSGAYTAGTTKTVRVQFNEKVTVTGNPTLVVTGSVAGSVTATYSSTNAAGDTLVFSFTVPAAGNTLSIGAQSVLLAGGTITETGIDPTVNASLTVSSTVAAAAGTKTTV